MRLHLLGRCAGKPLSPRQQAEPLSLPTLSGRIVPSPFRRCQAPAVSSSREMKTVYI